MQFGGDAKVEVASEHVVVRDEGVRHAACGDGHEGRSLHLDEAAPIHKATDGADDAASHNGDAPCLRVGDEVEVSLSEANLHILQAVPLLRQRSQRLAQQGELLRLHRHLPCARTEKRSLHAEPVADVEVVQHFVRVGEGVAAEHDLNASVAIKQVCE